MDRMTSRERVRAAAKGLPVDRVPVFHWLNPHAACRMMDSGWPAQSKLWNFLGRRFWRRFKKGSRWLHPDIPNALPLLLQIYANADYLLELGADMADVPYGTTDFWGKLYLEKGRVKTKDVFGSIRGMGGIYMDVIEPAIKDIKDLVNFKLPDATASKHYDRIREFRAKHPGAFIFSDNFGVQDLPTTQIWEMSKFMMALMDYPDEVKSFQQRFADWNMDIARRSFEAGADAIILYDDYGYTGRTLISMDMWREFTLPHLKRQIADAHEAGGLVMLHSCGFQEPFLPHYVEAGLDMLQSFQPKAGNDFEKAFAEYGDKLCFVTGIDVQQGESMTADELSADITRSFRIGRSGRFILGMTHMLQHTMPHANLQALFRTVRDIQEGMALA